MNLMSSNSIQADPVKKSDFYSGFPGKNQDLNRIRAQSLASFHRLFRDELLEKQNRQEDETEKKDDHLLRKFFEEHIELVTDQAKAGKTLSQYERSGLSLIKTIKRNRRKLEVTRYLPISYQTRNTSKLLKAHAENYVLNQSHFCSPKGHVYSNKL